jgi:hypothetical protein
VADLACHLIADGNLGARDALYAGSHQCGPWFGVCGPWSVVCGPWSVVRGLWVVVVNGYRVGSVLYGEVPTIYVLTTDHTPQT